MLIFCCGMPRSGGTLLYQLTKEIAGQKGIRGKGFAKRKIKRGVVKADRCEGWMIERINNGALAFGTYRDFRDVIVSLRTFYTRRSQAKGRGRQWTVKDVLEYRPNILEVYRCWQPYAMWFRYEDDNLALNIVENVTDFLGVSLSSIEKQAIIDKYSLVSNEKRIRGQNVWMEAGDGSMLTKIHISPTRGRSTWREALSREDLVRVEAIGGNWLKEYGY